MKPCGLVEWSFGHELGIRGLLPNDVYILKQKFIVTEMFMYLLYIFPLYEILVTFPNSTLILILENIFLII